MSGLVGKFVLWDEGEYFKLGEVLERLDDVHYLLKPLPCPEHPTPTQVISIDAPWDMILVFSTKQELEDYMVWVETPSDKAKPKVIAINGKTTEH